MVKEDWTFIQKFRMTASMKQQLQSIADEEYEGQLQMLIRRVLKDYLDGRDLPDPEPDPPEDSPEDEPEATPEPPKAKGTSKRPSKASTKPKGSAFEAFDNWVDDLSA